MRNKGFQPIPKGEKLIVEMPGGGGYGDPKSRNTEHVAGDVLSGFIDREAAEAVYGVALTETLELDGARTRQLRGGA
jgi:N-methylhydantoinase B